MYGGLCVWWFVCLECVYDPVRAVPQSLAKARLRTLALSQVVLCPPRWYDLDQGDQRQQRPVAEWTLAALVQLMAVSHRGGWLVGRSSSLWPQGGHSTHQ